MEMYIPEIGDNIILTEDWEVTLIKEERNKELFIRLLGYDSSYGSLNYISDYNIKIDDTSLGITEYTISCRFNNYKVTCEGIREALHYIFSSISYANNSSPKHVTVDVTDRFKTNLKVNPFYKKETFTVKNTKITVNIDVQFKDFIIKIPKNTVLQIDRIYIRKGLEDFSSVSFIVKNSDDVRFKPKSMMTKQEKKTHPTYGTIRFFAKLSDVNKIQFDKI